MDQVQATEFIVQALARGQRPEVIARTLCQQTGWPPAQVMPFVRRVADARGVEAPADVTSPVTPGASSGVRERSVDASMMPSTVQETPVAALDETMVQFVIRELGARRSRESIIQMLCERTGQPWHEVRHLVRRVEIEHSDQIAARSGRLLAVLGILITLAGVLSTAFVAYAILQGEVYGEWIAFFVAGIGMIVGGLVGTWRAWRAMRG
jgi:hypothetical protein